MVNNNDGVLTHAPIPPPIKIGGLLGISYEKEQGQEGGRVGTAIVPMAIRDVLKRDAASLLKLVDRVDDLEKQLAIANDKVLAHTHECFFTHLKEEHVKMKEQIAAVNTDKHALEIDVNAERKLRAHVEEQLAASNAKISEQDEAFEAAKIGVSHLEAMYSELESENGRLKKELADYKKAMTRHISVPKSWIDETIKQLDTDPEILSYPVDCPEDLDAEHHWVENSLDARNYWFCTKCKSVSFENPKPAPRGK
jgi:hypothetical protein